MAQNGRHQLSQYRSTDSPSVLRLLWNFEDDELHLNSCFETVLSITRHICLQSMIFLYTALNNHSFFLVPEYLSNAHHTGVTGNHLPPSPEAPPFTYCHLFFFQFPNGNSQQRQIHWKRPGYRSCLNFSVLSPAFNLHNKNPNVSVTEVLTATKFTQNNAVKRTTGNSLVMIQRAY